jgi:pimeloyl-ACP methyl ester carboxylesterase
MEGKHVNAIQRTAALAAIGTMVLVAAHAPHARAELKTTEFGKGPTIVMVHGLGSKRATWLPVARKLLGTHHVVMMDLPGHGESPAPDPFSLEACGAELAAALAKFDPKSTVVVGQGVGGLVLLHALDKNPTLISGMVLVEAATKPTMNIPDQQQRFFLEQLDENYDEFIQLLYAQLARDSVQGVQLRSDAKQVEPRVMKAYMRYLLKADASRVLDKIEMPELFVVSERRMPEGKAWPEVAAEFGIERPERMPHERIAKSGSMIHMDQPDSLAAALARFTAKALTKEKK